MLSAYLLLIHIFHEFTHSDLLELLRYIGIDIHRRAYVGMAENASDDTTYELVFKRADKAMYDDQAAFKKAHAS